MKTYLSLIAAAALALSACGGESSKPAEQTTPPAASAEAAPASAAEVKADANVPEECRVSLSSGDAMKFDAAELNVKAGCKEVALTFKHTGQANKAAMGHNVVIAKVADKDGIVTDATGAGADNNYVKPNDERVIAATKLLGGGEEDTVVFAASKLAKGEEYVFFCTFPGHAAQMNGKVKLVD